MASPGPFTSMDSTRMPLMGNLQRVTRVDHISFPRFNRSKRTKYENSLKLRPSNPTRAKFLSSHHPYSKALLMKQGSHFWSHHDISSLLWGILHLHCSSKSQRAREKHPKISQILIKLNREKFGTDEKTTKRTMKKTAL